MNKILSKKILYILIFSVSQIYSQTINNAIWKDTKGTLINAHGGSINFFKGKFYWYGEDRVVDFTKIGCSFIPTHKLEKNKNNVIGLSRGGIHCYSSIDLVNWKDEGVILPPNFTNENSEMAYGSIIERPKVIYCNKTKQFVMHFKLKTRLVTEMYANYGSPMKYGVAVSYKPFGPFTFHHSYLAGFDIQGGGDETIFEDEDGSAYLFFAAKPGAIMYYSKLSDDFLNPKGPFKPCEGIENKIEAPAIMKANGIYHLFASGTKGYNATAPKYAYSTSIHGPWTELKSEQSPYSPLAESGKNPQNNIGAEVTFGGQSTHILPIPLKKNVFIIMYDVWNTKDIPSSTYFWLPIKFDKSNKLNIKWYDKFDISKQ